MRAHTANSKLNMHAEVPSVFHQHFHLPFLEVLRQFFLVFCGFVYSSNAVNYKFSRLVGGM